MEDDIKRILQDKLVHLQLKSEQKEIIQNVFQRKDSMAVLPTGFGKSTCYVPIPSQVVQKETKMLFKRCMDFRRSLFKTQNLSENDKARSRIYNHLQDVVNETLCPKGPNNSLFKIACLNRECSDCGSKLLNLLTDEKS